MPLDRSQSKVFASLKLTASSSSSVGTHYIRSIYINISLCLYSHLCASSWFCVEPMIIVRTSWSTKYLHSKFYFIFLTLSHCLSLSSDSLHSHVPHFRTSHRYQYCICAYLERSCWLLVSKEYLKMIYSTKKYSMLFYDLINTDVYLAP